MDAAAQRVGIRATSAMEIVAQSFDSTSQPESDQGRQGLDR